MACGEISGYWSHLDKREETCKACRAAKAKYNKRHKALKELGHTTTNLVDIRGTIRRLQALMCMEWPTVTVMDMAGVRHRAMSRLQTMKRIRKDDADRIAKVYDKLCMRRPTNMEVCGRIRTNTRTTAKKYGYAPPLAWDDIDLEDKPHNF